MTKEQRRKIKNYLRIWGGGSKLCEMKMAEIERMNRLKERVDKSDAIPQKRKENLKKHYDEHMHQLEKGIYNTLKLQTYIEIYIGRLRQEEQMALKYLFRDGMSTDAAHIKMNYSRGNFFKIEKAAFENLTAIMEREPLPKELELEE